MNADLVQLLATFPGAELVDCPADDRASYALAYAAAGQHVFPLRGKVPAISKTDGGNGVLDATTDLAQIVDWWTRHPNSNIGGRVPEGVIVVDLDPRHNALTHLEQLEREHGPMITRTSYSGRGDGGRHFWFRHPGGKLSAKRLPSGWDLKTSSGYVVLPPSIHPDSRQPYRWDEPVAPIASTPRWLVDLLRPEIVTPRPRRSVLERQLSTGDSPADWFTANHSWHDILTGWQPISGDGDTDGSKWRHPAASHDFSATIRHGLLFVYSPNTDFDVTEADTPHGYTKFRAWATLNYAGNLSAAALAAIELRKAAA